jgi:hypothetical protein
MGRTASGEPSWTLCRGVSLRNYLVTNYSAMFDGINKLWSRRASSDRPIRPPASRAGSRSGSPEHERCPSGERQCARGAGAGDDGLFPRDRRQWTAADGDLLRLGWQTGSARVRTAQHLPVRKRHGSRTDRVDTTMPSSFSTKPATLRVRTRVAGRADPAPLSIRLQKVRMARVTLQSQLRDRRLQLDLALRPAGVKSRFRRGC